MSRQIVKLADLSCFRDLFWFPSLLILLHIAVPINLYAAPIDEYLFGGELQYFRIRDAASTPTVTKAMWNDRLNGLVDAGMNFVTIYIPWDYHELTEGTFTFSGVRDISYFLGLCYQKGLKVAVKPGPYITAEWPTGFGSFGAVPGWLKENYPDTLVRKPDGTPWSFDTFGGAAGYQCSYLHPQFLSRVQLWFDAISPIIQEYIFQKPCIVNLQLENETNLFWGDHYELDYSTTAVNWYRNYLQATYGRISQLNSVYGSSYSSYAEITPPTAAPEPTDPLSANQWHFDWFEAAQEMISDYQQLIKSYWLARGITENDVTFTTNDSPFSISTPFGIIDRQIIMADGTRKNRYAMHALDTYPRQDPTVTTLLDYPFQADWSVRLYSWWNRKAGYQQYQPHVAEIQGGFYNFPAGITPEVSPKATDATMQKLIGGGMEGGGIYIFAGGINNDNSDYDFQAAISYDGTRTERYNVLQKWGTKFVQPCGNQFVYSESLSSPIAIVYNSAYISPQGGIDDHLQSLTSNEYAGVFGWFLAAGFQPDVIDIQNADATDLGEYALVVYLNPDIISPLHAQKLVNYVANGGTLMQFLWPGRKDRQGIESSAHQQLQDMFGAQYLGKYTWPLTPFSGDVNCSFGTEDHAITSFWYESFWDVPSDATVFLWERNFIGGTNGNPVGFYRDWGNGTVIFIGTHLGSVFNRPDYYDDSQTYPWSDINVKVRLLRWLMGHIGIAPIFKTEKGRQQAWARADSQNLWLFVSNDEQSNTVTVEFNSPENIPIVPDKLYSVQNLFETTAEQRIPGHELLETGISLSMDQYEYTLFRIRAVPPVPVLKTASVLLLLLFATMILKRKW